MNGMARGGRSPSRYAAEELGHDEWIRSDIEAVGGNATTVRESAPDFDTDVMVAYAYDLVMRRNPIGLLGMVYVLEGTSVRLASTVAASLQKGLKLPVLRIHLPHQPRIAR